MEEEIRTCVTCCLRDIKAIETVKQFFLQIKMVENAYYIMIRIRREIFGKVHGHGDLTNQPMSRQTYWRGLWRQNCVRSPRAGPTFAIRSWS